MQPSFHNSELLDEMEKARQEFQKWILEQGRNCEEIKKKHQMISANSLGEISSLNEQIKTAKLTEKGVRQELAEEERKLTRLAHTIKKLREKENICPQELKQKKQLVEKEQEKLKALDKQLVDRQKEQAQMLNLLNQETQLYRERLGVELQRVGVSCMKLIFIFIDPNHPMRQFSFNLSLDETDAYHVGECKPALSGVAELVEALNSSKGDLGQFVVSMRKKFQQSIHAA